MQPETLDLNILDDLETPTQGPVQGPVQVADSSTPREVASTPTTPAPAERFDIPVQNEVTSTELADPITLDDVRAELQRRAQVQQNTPDLNRFDEDLPEPTPFNDPEAFIRSSLFGDREETAAEREARRIRRGIANTAGDIDERLEETRERAEETQQLDEREVALAETNEKIAQRQARFRREMRAFDEDAEVRGFDRGFVQSERQKREADATAEIADLFIIQGAQSGNVESARQYIDTAVNNRYRAIEIDLQQRREALAELLPTLEAEEKERAQALQIALTERANNLESEKTEAKNKRALMLEVAGLGASDSLQQQIINAPTEDQATMLASSFLARTFRAEQAAAAAAGGGPTTIKAPTIKEINGTDYQWNELLGIWEPVAIAGGPTSAEDAASTLDNLAFLRDATARIIGDEEKGYEPLYKGSAASPVNNITANLIKGTNRQKQLEAQVDTLRANMLTLATDPSIKEFFGPQMSDADVRLMTAAGTTLRPGSQSDEELLQETERIDEMLNRMETAINAGTSRSQNYITAPDGTLIELID